MQQPCFEQLKLSCLSSITAALDWRAELPRFSMVGGKICDPKTQLPVWVCVIVGDGILAEENWLLHDCCGSMSCFCGHLLGPHDQAATAEATAVTTSDAQAPTRQVEVDCQLQLPGGTIRLKHDNFLIW